MGPPGPPGGVGPEGPTGSTAPLTVTYSFDRQINPSVQKGDTKYSDAFIGSKNSQFTDHRLSNTPVTTPIKEWWWLHVPTGNPSRAMPTGGADGYKGDGWLESGGITTFPPPIDETPGNSLILPSAQGPAPGSRVLHDCAWVVLPFKGYVLGYSVDQANFQQGQNRDNNNAASTQELCAIAPFIIKGLDPDLNNHPPGGAYNLYTGWGSLKIPGDGNPQLLPTRFNPSIQKNGPLVVGSWAPGEEAKTVSAVKNLGSERNYEFAGYQAPFKETWLPFEAGDLLAVGVHNSGTDCSGGTSLKVHCQVYVIATKLPEPF